MRMIIDAHAHVFPSKIAAKATESIGNFYDIPMDLDGSVEGLLRIKETTGIAKFLIHSVATTPKQVRSINDFIAATVKEYPDTFIGFGSLHPDMENAAEEVERMIALGLKGVKLHPDFQKFDIDGEASLRLCRIFAGRLPLLVHAGDNRHFYSSPDKIARVLDAIPALDLIAAHFGGWSQWAEAEKELAGKRVWVDTSSSLYRITPERARELVDVFGVDYVLFGTDYPMWKADEELERLSELGLSEEELEKILHLNAERLLKL